MNQQVSFWINFWRTSPPGHPNPPSFGVAFGALGMSLHLHLTGRSPSKWNPKRCKKQSRRGWGGVQAERKLPGMKVIKGWKLVSSVDKWHDLWCFWDGLLVNHCIYHFIWRSLEVSVDLGHLHSKSLSFGLLKNRKMVSLTSAKHSFAKKQCSISQILKTGESSGSFLMM